MSLLPQFTIGTRNRFLYATAAIAVMIAFGSIGFHLLEGFTWNESIYIAAQTVTTVGYGDLTPHTMRGQLFATVFMIVGVGTVLFALTTLAQAIIQSQILEALGVRRKTKEMEKLTNHYIVCGAGRVGRRIIRNLQKENLPFVVIEKDSKKVIQFDGENMNILIADATIEDVLSKAGVERAHGLAACLADDAANVYVVLTARDMNKDLHIVARAVEEQAEPKLIRAGANRVIAPIIIGSQSMARALLKPTIADFMDSIVAENFDLVFEEVAVKNNSEYIDQELKATNISGELNLLIVAIRRKDGFMILQPSADTHIREGDLLIVIGKAEPMQKLIKASG
ncbi:MAG: potassium channel protein [Acidobacteriota bacterium]